MTKTEYDTETECDTIMACANCEEEMTNNLAAICTICNSTYCKTCVDDIPIGDLSLPCKCKERAARLYRNVMAIHLDNIREGVYN